MSGPYTGRVRPSIRRLALISFAILLPVAAHSLWDYVEMHRLIREIDAIRAHGEPVTDQPLNSLRNAADGNDRAGAYYLAAAMLALDATPIGPRTSPSAVLASVHEWLAGATREFPPGDTAQQLQTLVDDSRDALALTDRAAALPFDGFAAGTEFSYRVSGLATVSGRTAIRTVTLSLSGQGDQAVNSALTWLALRRPLRDTRWLLLGAHEVPAILSLSDPSANALAMLQTALEANDKPEQGADDLVRERARFLEGTWRRYYGGSPQTPWQYTWPMRSMAETLLRPWFTHRLVETLRVWAELIQVARIPWPQKAQASADILRRYPSPTPRTNASRRRNPADLPLAFFHQAVRPDTLIVDRSACVAVAVERFRRDHRGALPTVLQDLVPRYLASLPLDPLSGAPLLYRTSDEAYTVYSVGTNQKDDGGDLTSEWQTATTHAPGFRAIRGADIGVRVVIHR